jgi:hypothetical protein
MYASALNTLFITHSAIFDIINLVVRALNADWLIAVVYQSVYHGCDETFIFTALITLVTSLQ